jgi:hypothetical protein
VPESIGMADHEATGIMAKYACTRGAEWAR